MVFRLSRKLRAELNFRQTAEPRQLRHAGRGACSAFLVVRFFLCLFSAFCALVALACNTPPGCQSAQAECQPHRIQWGLGSTQGQGNRHLLTLPSLCGTPHAAPAAEYWLTPSGGHVHAAQRESRMLFNSYSFLFAFLPLLLVCWRLAQGYGPTRGVAWYCWPSPRCFMACGVCRFLSCWQSYWA